MERFHVNARTELKTFRFCLIYPLWSQYFQGKMQMFFQVRFSAGEGKNPSALLSIPSPLLQCHRHVQISPVLQPHGRWIHSTKLPQLLFSKTAEQESRGPLPPAGPTTHTRHGGSKLSNGRCHRKHLDKLDRHHLTKGWEEQVGLTHGSAKQGGN